MNDNRKYQKNKEIFLELVNLGMPNMVIQDYLKISPATIYNYCKKLKAEGVWPNLISNPNRNWSQLASNYAKLGLMKEIPGKHLVLISKDQLISSLETILQIEKVMQILAHVCRPLRALSKPGFSTKIPLGYQRLLEYLNPGSDLLSHQPNTYKNLWQNYLRVLAVSDDVAIKKQSLNSWQDETINIIIDHFSQKIRPNIAPVFEFDVVRRIEEFIFPTLNEAELSVIKMSFGINCKESSLQEIGKKLGKTRSRISQIFHKVIRRLKNQRRLEILLAFPLTWNTVSKLLPAESPKSLLEKITTTDITKLRVADVNFSARTQSVFRTGEILFLSELCSYRESDLLKFRNLGRKSLNDIKKVLKKYGLYLKK